MAKKKERAKSVAELVNETWPASATQPEEEKPKSIHIHHPPGTHHTMSRTWLEENSIVEVKLDAPEVIRNRWLLLSITPHAGNFIEENKEHMRYINKHGSYDYRTTLKIMDMPDEETE